MKKVTAIVSLLLVVTIVKCQDTVFMSNGSIQTGKVEMITEEGFDGFIRISEGENAKIISEKEIRYVKFEKSNDDVIYVDKIDINGLDNEFIQIIGYSKGMFTNKLIINIDYGQRTSFFGKKAQIVEDKLGRYIEFHSMIHALNYLTKRGWEFVSNYPMSSSQGTAYHYLLKREMD